MVKPFLLGVALIFIMAFVMACGSAEESETTTETESETTTQTTATEAPTEAAMEEEEDEEAEAMAEEEEDSDQQAQTTTEEKKEDTTTTSSTTQETSEDADKEDAMMEDIDPALLAAAAERAGKPGSFYIGDLSQLVGPSPGEGLGDADDMVNLAGLERERYLFDSDYYRNLVERANFTNPTELVYDGDPIQFQYACINRTLATCELVDAFFRPQIEERTNGKFKIVITSFPELGLAGPDSLDLVDSGTLSFAEIYGGYIAGHLPEAEIALLYGLYPDHEVEFKVTQAIQPDIDAMYSEATGGGQVVFHKWISGGDQFFFCKDSITSLAEFEGKKTRSHGAALSDWIEGMGADAQFVAFAEVYTALERGILDCGVTVAFAAHAQRWYEVTEYMVGPLSSQLLTNAIINKEVWEGLPPDVQQILLEEGARHELEAMRVTPAWNEVWVDRNVEAGLTFQPFNEELMTHMKDVAVMEHVIPGFVNRVGGGDADIIKLFNEEVAHIVGLRINSDGSTESVPITE
jgi:TRAP-type C4-dicarboxylate transport system substrate-binding protein